MGVHCTHRLQPLQLQPIPPGLKPRCVAVTWRRSRRPCQLQSSGVIFGFSWSQLAPRLASWTSSHGLRTFEIRNESKCEISMDSVRTSFFFWQCVLHVLFVSFFKNHPETTCEQKRFFRDFRPQFRTKSSPSARIFRNIPMATPCGLWT